MEAASGPTQPPWLPPSRAIRVGSTPSWAARQATAASASGARSWRLWPRQSPPEEPQPGLSQPRLAKPALARASASDILEGRDAASPATAMRGRPWSGWRRRPAARGARSSTTSRPSWTCSWPCWSRTPSVRPPAGRPARSPTPSPAWPPRTRLGHRGGRAVPPPPRRPHLPRPLDPPHHTGPQRPPHVPGVVHSPRNQVLDPGPRVRPTRRGCHTPRLVCHQ
jgi:hypothetical protein